MSGADHGSRPHSAETAALPPPTGVATPASHGDYRGDIDGLRAIAVVPVVLFHAGVHGFAGGFVGVDIFFVISGYLITGILLRDQQAGRLSIAEFYRRRILRIFPALIAMAAATSIGAVLWLMPGEWERYARSLAGTALFGSNIGFYLATDYFNTGALSEPLLHTWSLAVEEQWYLLWPLLIMALGGHRRGVMVGLVSAIVLISLGYSAWLLPRDQSATFYLLPTRAWEMGIGAWLAVAALRPSPRWLAELIGIVGLALIAFAIKVYSDDTAFPGLTAVPPCLGAAFLIHAGRSGTLSARVLAAPPLRHIGLISYSLYLWHWPVIVFARSGLFVGHAPLTTAAIVLVSVILAYLSWRYVERPFRTGSRGWSTPAVLRAGGAAMAAMVAVALVLPATAARLAHYSPGERHIAAYLAYDGDGAYRRGTCFKVGSRNLFDARDCLPRTGKPVIAFVGDSHAAQLWPGLSAYRRDYDLWQATATGCVAVIPARIEPNSCESVVATLLGDRLRTDPPAALVLASRWRLYNMDELGRTLADPRIRAAHPLLVGPIPQYETELPRLVLAAERRHDPGVLDRNQLEEPFVVDRIMRAMARRNNVPYLSLVDLFCDARRHCRSLAAPAVPLQFDYGHLTAEGSGLVAQAILKELTHLYPAVRVAGQDGRPR